MPQGIQEQIRILLAIEEESHFVQVGGEMLCADLVPASNDAALEQRESGFDRVGVDVSSEPDIFFLCVIDSLMLDIANGGFVSLPFVGNQYLHIRADVFLNVLRQLAGLCISRMEETEFAVALSYADDSFFLSSHSGFLPRLTNPALLPADVGFIHFDGAVQHGLFCFLHGSSDTVTEIPCGFVADSQGALDLISRHSFASFAEQKSGKEPFLQWEMGVVEDRARRDRELVITGLAIEQLLGCRKFYNGAMTTETFGAIRPAQPHKQLAALVIGIKQIDYVN